MDNSFNLRSLVNLIHDVKQYLESAIFLLILILNIADDSLSSALCFQLTPDSVANKHAHPTFHVVDNMPILFCIKLVKEP